MLKTFCDNCEAQLSTSDRDTRYEVACKRAKTDIRVTISFRYAEYDQPHPHLCGACAKDFARQTLERIVSGRTHAS